ncbi:MAG: undecaprenyl-diphosphate phosphatase [Clostridia bacterium]|nr:undecaprenyl-diphosphate phosphatase [Clostridia bacterium]
MLNLLKSFLVGIVQGITEWLPISSTGHIILVNDLFPLDVSVDFWSMFSVVIQLGSILAVLVLYFSRLWPLERSGGRIKLKKSALNIWSKVIVACIPAAILGFLLDDWLEGMLYEDEMHVAFEGAMVIAAALIVYGVFFIVIEKINKNKKFAVADVESMSYKRAFGIGLFQSLALIPGTSRSGSTIMGASVLGVGRTAAAEFSFFLAVPVMFGASGLKIAKYFLKGNSFTFDEVMILLVGCVTAFAVSVAAIKFLMSFVRNHSFASFGWYRIVLGIVVILYFVLR